MGFATPEQYQRFLRQAPIFEQVLVEEGVHLTKYWFSVTSQNSGPDSSSARSTPSGSGSCHRWT